MTDESDESDPAVVLDTILGLVALPIKLLVMGVMLSLLWQWFITPLGAPVLAVPHAAGMALTIGWVTNHREVKGPALLRGTAWSIACVLVVFFGWCLHGLM